MFDSAEVGHAIDKKTWNAQVPGLRAALLNAQYDLAEQKKFPVVIVIGGVEGAGKGETVNLLLEWMDPRHIQVRAFPDPSDEERERPPMWRFWRALPPRGKIGILFGGWHTEPIVDRVNRNMSAAELDQRIQRIVRFERMLVDEGALLLKIWFHISRAKQKERLRTLSRNPLTAWRVTKLDWKRFKQYDEYRRVSEHYIRQTSSGEAPWIVVEGTDPRYRGLTVGKEVLAAVRERLDQKKLVATPDRTPPLLPSIDRRDVLQLLDYEKRLGKERYQKQLERWQGRLATLTRDRRFRDHAVAAVFEGSDAAGKGGAIRRITGALDARQYEVIPIAAPTEEERAQPYLWRFWRHVPRRGRFMIFDRSWYGRVLVERVEGFAAEADWMRAYSEINDFEDQLGRAGLIVVKFYLAITKPEQLKRFRLRQRTEFKRFKITAEDWRNRKKWEAYNLASCEMIDRTSTDFAPWELVASNDKYLARIQILKTLCRQIERALGGK